MTSAPTNPKQLPKAVKWCSLAAAAGCLFWAYWPTLAVIAGKWSNSAQYSHGFLVPIFAGVLLFLRSSQFQKVTFQPTWVGALIIAAAGLLRLGGAMYVEWLDFMSLLLCIVGVTVLLGGWRALNWNWPAIAFLIFMLPLPYQVETGLAYPLRRVATIASTFALQTMGMSAFSEGNTILINEARIGVEEACNGLSMLLVFFALSTGLVMMVNRPWLDKALIVLSALPIAILANVIRITATAAMHVTVGGKAANIFFHDVAGWLMMPIALGLMWLELKLLSKIFVEVSDSEPVPIFAPMSQASAGKPEAKAQKHDAKPPKKHVAS